ncbi:SDR family NAD(P)-dependent oxidoreductase [Aquicella lusitana]|uniref:NADP-dependent 3-hydroxy acid dehydrogenase YdfG n=1 Tax=Aquicella lusitana TaxID=254246 RepID=A0A370GJ14_9COXI|nr:SDR family NAD(P)-dependent oxidoreductase [Aquicella lusitana]RDI43735.1 NADP-dependent 3-hydroxy acid dehydrogenase YdfG [Aquicella lusitana]VVC74534.1 4-formylbenzenesulfonate dehydrogenase TsaC1/TsaC2 [Aquicella lusitana]
MTKESGLLAVLIGAGPGLGAAIAKRFARENYIVAMISRHQAPLQTLADEIKESGGMAIAFPADVTQEEDVKSVFTTLRKYGHPEVLIYNAASKFELNGIGDIAPDDFIQNWKVMCLGGLLTSQQVLPDMVQQKKGTIIFSGATASLRGGAKLAAFAVGKFSQRALAQSMAREFGPKGIHVAHVIIDGQIATPAVLKHFPDRPLNTFLNPDAIAETYWYLHLQDPSTWTHELDLRPSVEKF